MSTLSDKIYHLDPDRIPQHVAIIMDGNGRWAKQHGQERSFGHENGVATVRQTTEIASEVGVKYLTLYTFSTENWNRPQDEVDALMNLIVVSIEQQTPDLIKNNVRLTTIGNMDRMPEFAASRLRKCMEDTSQCTGLVLCPDFTKEDFVDAIADFQARERRYGKTSEQVKHENEA